jgi:signal transduction histidine kinase
VSVTVTGAPAAVAVPVDLTAYRIIQEALTNALRHGGPVASVMIEYGPSEVRVEITDDGLPGIPVLHRGRDGTGHGLIGMRERVAVFGGLLSTGSRPGGGFRVDARLPMTQDPA